MITIIPAILTNSPDELREKMMLLEGKVERIQIDIVDGIFAQNKTILPDVLEEIETSLLIDFHLMTKEPTLWVERCVRGMADRIFGQVEEMTNQMDFVAKVEEVGAKVGLALDRETPISALDSSLLTTVDGILVMSTKAGFGGQEFDPNVLEKVRRLDAIRSRDKTPFQICVDGGVNDQTIGQVAKAGADQVAVGLGHMMPDVSARLRQLLEAAYGK